MAPRYEVREVQDRGHYWQVVYDVRYEGGAVAEHGHSIPKETLEWRAAEYDLDPDVDFEQILDIVLAEPYIDQTESPGTVAGEELHDAPDIETAKSRHVSRCARAKLKYRISTRANKAAARASDALSNPLDIIREQAVIDKDVVLVKKEYVKRLREKTRERKVETSKDRLARISRELLGMEFNVVDPGVQDG